jgi:hydrophobic/amphiphilic exporter-1 (mainly G- bacteria), HAE1 family
MSLASFCVRRPVTTTMIYMGVLLLGTISWLLMPRELFPSITFPQLVVVTRYGNAAPEEIENLITKVIEEAVGTVPNLKRVRSLSKEGISLVTLEFDWGTDMGFAHLSAREKIDQLKDRLPDEAEEPIINRVNPFAQPMVILSVSGELELPVLTQVTNTVIKPRLEKVTGVASAVVSGGQEREILVEIDRGRMEASGVSLSHVVDALRNTNLNYPAGTTQGKFYEYLVRTIGEFQNISEIGRTVIQVDKPPEDWELERPGLLATRAPHATEQRLLHLDTIGVVKDTYKEKTSYSRHDGKENVSVAIQKQADANTLKVARRVREAVNELRLSIPKTMTMEVVYDESKFIGNAISGVTRDGILGGILAFLVLYYFLRSAGAAAIVSTAIPASALITFVSMYFGDISLNMLSLAGLGLAVGNLVDNSIVVLENITRHRQDLKKSPADSAIDGTDEVAASMVTSALTNVAVLLPLLFAKGVAQQIFKDMFFVVSAASFASLIISLTLVPRLMGHPLSLNFLKRSKGAAEDVAESPAPAPGHEQFGGAVPADGIVKRVFRWFTRGMSEEAFEHYMYRYQHMLAWVLSNPRKTAFVLAGGSCLAVLLLFFQDKVFMPKLDQGQFILKVQMPVGTRLEVTDRVARKVEGVLKEVEGVKGTTTNVGSNQSDAVDALGAHQSQIIVNVNRNLRTTNDVIENLKARLEQQNLEGAEIQYILQDSVLASAFETSAPIVVEIKGPDLVTLRKLSEDISADLAKVEGIYGIKSSLALPSAETRVSIDKVRAAGYQLSVSDIARVALIGVKGYVATTYKEGGQEVDVRVQLRPQDRKDTDDIRRLAVRAPNGIMVPLSEIASLASAQGPSEIKHIDQQRSVVLSANILKRSTSRVIADVSEMLKNYQNLTEYNVTLTGESAQMKESFGGLAIAMILAVVLVYMIMAAEFESLWNPFIIMFTIPFSVVGVAITLFLTRTPLSAPVILGVIILAGMVVNNGIVLIDYMKILQSEGRDLWEVVLEGGATRLRPIAMSCLTTILGVLPLALGISEGSELSSPMAVVTFGGLGVSALLSLFVIPLLYYYSEIWMAERRAAAQPGAVVQG